MPIYRVTPDPDGSGWVVQSNGTIVSRHHKKRRANRRAKQLSNDNGGHVIVHRSDGTNMGAL